MSKSSPVSRPLRIAVVGHTNTGKTSLLRTLTRNPEFGKVSANPSTTRHVEGTSLSAGGELVVDLYDTPGLEDAIALLDLLDRQAAGSGSRLDGPARIQRFLDSSEAHSRFEQEAKVLRQTLHSDAAIYVIDARDPVLAKYRDELQILASCAVPVLPLLNFVRDSRSNEQVWREALARLGLHVLVSFDTVAPARDGETILYERLATLLDQRGISLRALAEEHAREAGQRRLTASTLVAEMLVDVAACRVRVKDGGGIAGMGLGRGGAPDALQRALDDINARVRLREQECVDALLGLYRFRRDDVTPGNLPFSDGRWRDDLFDPATLTAMGITVGGGAAAGAAAGLGVDLMLGGATLGTAAAIGAVLGGGVQTARRFGRRLSDGLRGTVTGERTLRIDDSVLQLLAARQVQLLEVLAARGHAAVDRIVMHEGDSRLRWEGRLSTLLNRARHHPDWSKLNRPQGWNPDRQQLIDQLAGHLSKSTPEDPAGGLGDS